MRMASLVDNILDFARGRLGGGITLTLSAQPLQPTLQQVVDELQSTHPESIIKTEFALTKPLMADPVRIGQLFSNLLGNALTHGVEGRAGGCHGEDRRLSSSLRFATRAIQSRLKPWSGCSTHSRVARYDQASRAWVLASTLRPRSPRRTAARLR